MKLWHPGPTLTSPSLEATCGQKQENQTPFKHSTHRRDTGLMMGSESSDYRHKRHPSGSPDTPNKKRPPVGGDASLDDPEDAITQDEIHGAELPSDNGKPSKVRNACRAHPHLRSVPDQLTDHRRCHLSSLRAHGPETKAKS